jgi:hypothetical protein
MMHYWNLIWDWNTVDSVRTVHSFLEGWALVFFALLVLFDVLAHLYEDEHPSRANLFERTGLWFFGVAVFSEILAYPYSQRNDTLSSQQDANQRSAIAALNNSTQGLKTEAQNAKTQAEDERAARVKIEDSVAWRSFSPYQQKEITSALSRFAGQLVECQFLSGDTEAFAFSSEIAATLRAAMWQAIPPSPDVLIMRSAPPPTTMSEIRKIDFGVELFGTSSDSNTAAHAITEELENLGFDAHTEPPTSPSPPTSRVLITVFHRPLGPQGEAKLRAEKSKKKP